VDEEGADAENSSPSELLSGSARFFPLGSRTGSLIVKAIELGNVARRFLNDIE
jgi:hypothetical protein